ncbi:MAG: LemA family protein [Gemmatimonadota bacterium]
MLKRSQRSGKWLARALAALAAASVWGGCGYSQILELDERAEATWNDIEVQLQRRAELVPSLVETVLDRVTVDETLIAAVSDARAQLAGAVRSGDVAIMEAANADLRAGLNRLLALAVRQPELQADGGFQLLRSQLGETEEQLIEAGRAYNLAVRRYNDYIGGFPQLVTAKVFGAERREPFAVDSGPAAAPSADE